MDTLFVKSSRDKVVKLHPVVVFSILDSFLRRSRDQDRVFGTLLGRYVGNSIEVTNCFTVQHQYNPETQVMKYGMQDNKIMSDLLHRVNPGEIVVGWFATTPGGEFVTGLTVDIHEHYSGLRKHFSPIHLVVDTSLSGERITIKAFTQKVNKITAKYLIGFQEVPVQLESSDAEKIAMDMMIDGMEEAAAGTATAAASKASSAAAGAGSTSLASGMDVLERSLKRLQGMLGNVTQYVDDVVDGKREPDAEMGRQIAEALSAIPHVDPADFRRLFEGSLQDLLMVVYLANLTQTHIGIAEKITSALPL